MELTKYQNELLDNTDELMKKHNIIDGNDYNITVVEEGNLQTASKTISIKVQLKDDEVIVKQLKKIGWKIDHKYYSDGNPMLFSEDAEYPTEFEGDVEMIQLVFK